MIISSSSSSWIIHTRSTATINSRTGSTYVLHDIHFTSLQFHCNDCQLECTSVYIYIYIYSPRNMSNTRINVGCRTLNSKVLVINHLWHRTLTKKLLFLFWVFSKLQWNCALRLWIYIYIYILWNYEY